MKDFKQMLADYVYEISTADIFLTADNKLRFNTVRSRKFLQKKLIRLESSLMDYVQGRNGLDPLKVQRIAVYLGSMEQLFSFQESNQIWHKHFYIRCRDDQIELGNLLLRWKSLLNRYFTLQYESLQRLKLLLSLETVTCTGCYGWNDNIIALYEILNVLWETGTVIPLQDDSSKKAFFYRVFTLLGIQEKTENYHIRISQSINRKNVVLFLSKLIDRYKNLLADR